MISEVECHFRVKLARVGGYRKFLIDANGKSYWVLGGYEDWHGITAKMMKEEQRRLSDGVLVVAKRYRGKIDIFSGPLQPLIEHSGDLSHTQTAGYQFHITIRGNNLTVNEIQGLSLRKLGDSKYVGEAVEHNAAAANIDSMLAKMTPVERLQLLAKLKSM